MELSLPQDPRERRAAAWLLLFGAAWLALRLFLIRDRVFDGDELEHLHAAWLVARGQVPYRDFFEHHGPLLPYLLAPVTAAFSEPVRAIWAARLLMLAFTAGAMKLLWDMTPPGRGLLFRALPLVLLCSFTTFADKSLEVRPDVPAMALACLALRLAAGGSDSFMKRLLAGFSLGLAFFFTPKALYLGAGLAAGWLAADLAAGVPPARLAPRWAGFLAGAAAPAACVLAFFYINDGIKAFYHCFYGFNRKFRAGFPLAVFWLPSYAANPAVWTLGLTGAPAFWKDSARLGALAGAAAGAFHLPVVYPQYFLPAAPLLCLSAAGAYALLADRFGPLGRRALGIGLCVLLAVPFHAQFRALKDTNASQREGIACVMARTGPEDRVFDAWTGESFYRPHAWYFWFLHDEVRAMLPPSALETEAKLALADGRCRGLVRGEYFGRLPAGVLEAARKDFEFSGCGRLFLKKAPAAKQATDPPLSLYRAARP